MTNPMQKHEPFILDRLLPMVSDHAAQLGVDSSEAVMAAFLALGTVLQYRGFTAESLLMSLKSSAISTHNAPEVLQ